uniref:Uncharacterized protein n=1 Tax=Arundo donax TaxID=35708 RepID=A0A0A9B5U8_ARUDO
MHVMLCAQNLFSLSALF